jgi:hypothetical protein
MPFRLLMAVSDPEFENRPDLANPATSSEERAGKETGPI